MNRHALVWLLALASCGGDDADDEVGTSNASTDGSEIGESGDGETGGCPDNPNATACEACVLAECCEQLMACEDSETCSCVFDCVEQGNHPDACVVECVLSRPDLLYGQFTSCVQGKCVDLCS